MPVDFTNEPEVDDLARRTAEFVREVVIPVEEAHGGVLHDGPEDVRAKLQQAARDAGVFAPHAPTRWGGLGLDRRGQAVVFEEAGYSLFGPIALNIAAPDEGNVHLLEAVATPEQQERYLGPLARGDVRSCFAMTEPAPGAGADPRLVRTTAERVADGWRISGRKWFITGARGAAFAICMARTSGEPGDAGGATMFLVDADNPGMRVERDVPTLDEAMFSGHGEVVFQDCVVPDDAVLGEVDRGFHYAQVRLAPARLTHCMRWLGLARRAQDMAIDRSVQRSAFGQRLSDLGMVQQMIADSEIDLAASRALILQTAWVLDQGQDGGQASSIAKTFVAEAVWRIVDRAVQVCGSLGISGDILLSRYLREVRPFRIYDGPSETHRWAIARRVTKDARRRADAHVGVTA